MKIFACFTLFAAFFVAALPASAQRAVGGRTFVLDDGSGHTLTLTPSPMGSNQTFTFPAVNPFTQGGVIFADGSGIMAQDAFRLFWDNTTKNLGIGNSAPNEKLDVTGNIRLTGNVNTTAGALQTNGTTRIDNSGNASIVGLTTTGAQSLKMNTVAGAYAVAASDYVVIETANASTVTLPAPTAGRVLVVKYGNTVGTCLVAPNALETIDGVAGNMTLTASLRGISPVSGAFPNSVTLQSDGTNWWILSESF